jgi:hypothetical protein
MAQTIRLFLTACALGAAAMAAGCGGNPDQPTPTPTPQPPVVTPPTPTPPAAANTAPVIAGLTAQGTRRREPASLADAGEEIVVTATVTDAETPVERLTFEWSSPAGAFSGEGPVVRWRAPASVPAPFVATLQLRVVDGAERAERTVTVRVHDHVREVGEMATRFLEDFSDSRVPATAVLRNFLPGCYGTTEELGQVEANRERLHIDRATVGRPSVTVDFDGTCPYRTRDGDACSTSPVRWESTNLVEKKKEVADGVDQVAAVYRQDRWWLCDSQFDGTLRPGLLYRLLTEPVERLQPGARAITTSP